MLSIFVTWFFAAAPPRAMAPGDSAVVKKTIAHCRRVLGPVPISDPAKPSDERFAYACERRENTEVHLFARLPSGDFTTLCDKLTLSGELDTLEAVSVAGRALVHVRTRLRTPDEERDFEQLAAARWGRCPVVAESDIKHDLERTTLGEPRGGIEVDAAGFDVWQEAVRLKFGARAVATAMRGRRLTPEGANGWASMPIEAFAHTPLGIEARWPVALKPGKPLTLDLPDPSAVVRGVRVTGHDWSDKQKLHLQLAAAAGGQGTTLLSLDWRPADREWRTRGGVFGQGFLQRSVAEQLVEAVVFLEPALAAASVVLSVESGGLNLEKVQVFQDSDAWPVFDERE